MTIQGNMFEIYSMVSVDDNADLVLGFKICDELEAEISMKVLNRSARIFPVYKDMVKPKERRYMKDEAPFSDEISVLGIINIRGLNTYDNLTMKVKFE